MMRLEELRYRHFAFNEESDNLFQDAQDLVDRTAKVADFAGSMPTKWKTIDEEFLRQTKLEKADWVFIVVAVVLQVIRQKLLLSDSHFGETAKDDSERMGDQDKSIKDEANKKQQDYKKQHGGNQVVPSKKGYRTAMEIAMTKKVPYDAIKGGKEFELGLGGVNHRYKTLGHDPWLGWIFGTLNIITDTMTLHDFRTFDVDMESFCVEKTSSLVQAIRNCQESLDEDILRLHAAIFAQGVHLASDQFTKLGLPLPLLSVFDLELAQELCSERYDFMCLKRDAGIVFKQAFFAFLINHVVAGIHGMYYRPNGGISRVVYAVKTRKIIALSNLIAASSNVVDTCVKSWSGQTNVGQNVDYGGLAVFVFQTFQNVEFCYRVREEFISSHLFEQIQII